jgi:nitrogen fixation-related uncharacterized protein
MYFPYFITYIIIGFILTLVVFFWAHHNGQFKEQQRARFLPLEEEQELRAAGVSKISRYEVYALMFLACAGLAASGAVLIFALFFSKG